MQVTAVVLHTSTPSEVFTTYPVGDPLLNTPVVHVSTTTLFPGTALTNSGVVTQVALGVAALEAADAVPAPSAFVATTVNVYAKRFCRPVTLQDNSVVVEQLAPPGVAVNAYEVMTLPPLLGAAHVAVAVPSPAITLGAPGALGVVAGTTVISADGIPLPKLFVAVTETL